MHWWPAKIGKIDKASLNHEPMGTRLVDLKWLEMTWMGAGLGSANPKSHTLSNRKTLCKLWPNDALVWHCLASHATTTTDTPTQLALCRYVSVPNQTLPGLLPSATTIVSLLLHNNYYTLVPLEPQPEAPPDWPSISSIGHYIRLQQNARHLVEQLQGSFPVITSPGSI